MARRVERDAAAVWALVARQHGVASREQLLALAYSRAAIQHRIECGRLHPLWPGVYAVGRPALAQEGIWMAAVLASGPHAVLSHSSAAAAWGFGQKLPVVEISLPAGLRRQHTGIRASRRVGLDPWTTLWKNIPITGPALTLVDFAARTKSLQAIERAINEADKLDLVHPGDLRVALDEMPQWRGRGRLIELLDRTTFVLTNSRLEQLMLPIIRRIGLPPPITFVKVNGYEVDFWWPHLNLVIETDGLRHHRTASQQKRDALRDQAHVAAGTTSVRFTHGQVKFEPAYVEATLAAVVRRLESSRPADS